ncbi:MAG: hypothetical protein JSR90_22865 [Proteobacteria bacterium]|nr:hypothetical protein [Pseudomonadota bacterium]
MKALAPLIALALAAMLAGAMASAQTIAPGGSIANTTGIGSGLGDPRGTGPHYPNGTTQPVLPPPPPPGGNDPPLTPTPRLSTVKPPSYPQPTAPFGPPVSGPSGAAASAPLLVLPESPTGDVSFLAGCWRTEPFRYAHQTGVTTYCFGANGSGRFLYKRLTQLDYSCAATAQASYRGPQLRFHSSDMTCSDGSTAYPADLDCSRGVDATATCVATAETATGRETWSVRLRRAR